MLVYSLYQFHWSAISVAMERQTYGLPRSMGGTRIFELAGSDGMGGVGAKENCCKRTFN